MMKISSKSKHATSPRERLGWQAMTRAADQRRQAEDALVGFCASPPEDSLSLRQPSQLADDGLTAYLQIALPIPSLFPSGMFARSSSDESAERLTSRQTALTPAWTLPARTSPTSTQLQPQKMAPATCS
jgi:hypothetical protein